MSPFSIITVQSPKTIVSTKTINIYENNGSSKSATNVASDFTVNSGHNAIKVALQKQTGSVSKFNCRLSWRNKGSVANVGDAFYMEQILDASSMHVFWFYQGDDLSNVEVGSGEGIPQISTDYYSLTISGQPIGEMHSTPTIIGSAKVAVYSGIVD